MSHHINGMSTDADCIQLRHVTSCLLAKWYDEFCFNVLIEDSSAGLLPAIVFGSICITDDIIQNNNIMVVQIIAAWYRNNIVFIKHINCNNMISRIL